jgi:hypothetical protein
LLASLTAVPVTTSFAGASAASVVAYNNLGLLNPGAIAAHGKYVWVADRGVGGKRAEVVRVTASSGAHRSYSSPLLNEPVALTSDGTYVWVVNAASQGATHGSISRIDIATNKVSSVTTVSGLSFLVSLAVAGPYLWAAGVSDNGILRIDRATLAVRTISSTLFYPGAVLTADKKYVWVSSDGGGPLGRGSLARISVATNKVTGVNSPYFNDAVTVTSNGTSVWVPASNHVVVKVDIATSKAIKISSTSFSTSLWIESTPRYAYVLSDGGNPAGSGGTLSQINAVTNSVHVITSKSFPAPVGLAVLGSKVWIINSSLPPAGPTTKNLLVRVSP